MPRGTPGSTGSSSRWSQPMPRWRVNSGQGAPISQSRAAWIRAWRVRYSMTLHSLRRPITLALVEAQCLRSRHMRVTPCATSTAGEPSSRPSTGSGSLPLWPGESTRLSWRQSRPHRSRPRRSRPLTGRTSRLPLAMAAATSMRPRRRSSDAVGRRAFRYGWRSLQRQRTPRPSHRSLPRWRGWASSWSECRSRRSTTCA